MFLRLEIENPDAIINQAPRVFEANADSCAIGATDSCDWRLLDADNILAEGRCRLNKEDEGYRVTNLFPFDIRINEARVASGASALITAGAFLELGPFRISAQASSSSRSAATNKARESVLRDLSQNPNDFERTMVLGVEITDSAHQNSLTASLSVSEPSAIRDPPHGAARQILPVYSGALSAFARGAGLSDIAVASCDEIQFYDNVGRVVRMIVNGCLDLNYARVELKEFIKSRESGVVLGGLSENATLEDALIELFVKPDPTGQKGEALAQETLSNLLNHERAYFQAMQKALFRLLNFLSPDEIEKQRPRTFISSAKSAAWDKYVETWMRMTAPHENGLLDVFLELMGEAYDEEIHRK